MRHQRVGARVVGLDDDDVLSCPHVDVIIPNSMNEQVHVPHINLSTSRYGSNQQEAHTQVHMILEYRK